MSAGRSLPGSPSFSAPSTRPTPVPGWVVESLLRCGLVAVADAAALHGEPVTGGVSSEVWRVELASGPVCVKRALPKLAVERDWRVSTERSRWEARWLRLAARIEPTAACPLLAADEAHDTLVLAWLDPATHPVWKQQLAAGQVERSTAVEVGRRLARLHAGSLPHRFEFAEARPLFDALRLHPYLRATAARHPAVAARLLDLAAALAAADVTVIHGDVSPKNILVGPEGPRLLDAECASPGDPAFDLAFCTNHLLLKAVWRPPDRELLLDAATAMVAAYLDAMSWEDPLALERRVTALLPALALARVDGLSPVEYLSEDAGRPTVRRIALAALTGPATDHRELIARWRSGLEGESS